MPTTAPHCKPRSTAPGPSPASGSPGCPTLLFLFPLLRASTSSFHGWSATPLSIANKPSLHGSPDVRAARCVARVPMPGGISSPLRRASAALTPSLRCGLRRSSVLGPRRGFPAMIEGQRGAGGRYGMVWIGMALMHLPRTREILSSYAARSLARGVRIQTAQIAPVPKSQEQNIRLCIESRPKS
jgi:hypothetical protein